MATVAELEAVIAEFKQGGFEQEAQEVADALSALNAMGGDDGIAKLVERGKQTRAEEEQRAMRDAVGANEEDETASGLPSLEELNSAR
jgi:hypothetical protein